MADLMRTMSALLEKLKGKPRPDSQPKPQATLPTHKKTESVMPSVNEGQLRSFDEGQLKDFVSQQPERTILYILQSLTDPVLQLRIIEGVSDESTLKRVSRSGLSKKIKRAAEKKLSTTGPSGMRLRFQKLARLNEQMQAFLGAPHWADGQELLALVFSPDLVDGPIDEASTTFTHFMELRSRLKREVEGYERTYAELEDICRQLDPSQSLSKSAAARLQDRWTDLSEKYPLPKGIGVSRKYEEILAARMARQAPVAQVVVPPRVRQDEQADHRQRLAAVENLLRRIREVGENIADPQAGALLRKLQNEALALKRWKREYPAALEEAETLLKTLTSKRTEAIDEAKWDAWARTDLAIRIQAELEEIIGILETEQDSEIALKKSVGLTGRLHEYAKEMRALGSLERDKDHKIWQQFKSLSNRGWVVCDRMRLLVFEKLKTLLSEHASKPIEFTSAALSNPRAPVKFNDSAFADEVAARIKELRSLWLEIGAKTSEGGREVETVFARLFETYFRQMNLRLGQQQRVENAAMHSKRELLREMKIACEGKSTLISRARVAKGLEAKWNKAAMPASVKTELQSELEAYQALLNAELTGEIEKHLGLAMGLQTQVQAVLESIEAKNGASLSQALKAVSGFESELLAMEKHLGQFKGLFCNDAAVAAEKKFQEIRRQILTLIQECKTAAAKETNERAQQRNRVLLEAEKLALSTDWVASQARFEELRALWKKTGALGQSQDAIYGLLFENVWEFYLSRSRSREQVYDSDQRAKHLKTREELIYSLEALSRLRAPRAGSNTEPGMLPLPFAPAKMLEFGLKYKHVLSLDPKDGILKETKKIMAKWAGLGMIADEFLPAFWAFYLDRVHTLLELRLEQG